MIKTEKKRLNSIWIVFAVAALLLAGRCFYVAAAGAQPEGEKTGFILENGAFRYYDPVTHEALKGQKFIDNDWFMFDPETGAMVTGFYRHTEETNPRGGPKTCYYDNSGKMAKGQRKIDGYWYNFNVRSGEMITGFLYIKSQDKTVYYDGDGRMLYGAQIIGGEPYEFETKTGAMISGEIPET